LHYSIYSIILVDNLKIIIKKTSSASTGSYILTDLKKIKRSDLMIMVQRKAHFLNSASILTFYYIYSIVLVDY